MNRDLPPPSDQREDDALHDAIASKTAGKFRRKCWWADRDDLYQEARLAILRARRSWDPQVGVPFERYAARGAVVALWAACWRQSAPVTASDHDLANLRGLIGAEVSPALPARQRSAEDLYDVASLVAAVRERVEAVGSPLACEVLLEERRASEVAARNGVPVQKVYSETAAARRNLEQDPVLWALWRAC